MVRSDSAAICVAGAVIKEGRVLYAVCEYLEVGLRFNAVGLVRLNCELFGGMSYYRGGVILARNGCTVMPDPSSGRGHWPRWR